MRSAPPFGTDKMKRIALDETIRCDDDDYRMSRIAKTFRRG